MGGAGVTGWNLLLGYMLCLALSAWVGLVLQAGVWLLVWLCCVGGAGAAGWSLVVWLCCV